MPEDIFADEWRESLRAHYMDVMRRQDKLTEKTLTGLMLGELGFSEAELRELTILATMHVDDVGADFVPDMDVLENETEAEVFISIPEPQPEAPVVDEVEAVPAEEVETEAETEVEAELELEESEPPPVKRPDDPKQLSLF